MIVAGVAVVVCGTVHQTWYEVVALDDEGQPVGEEYSANDYLMSGGYGNSPRVSRSEMFVWAQDTAREMAGEMGLGVDRVDVRYSEDW